MDDMVDELDKRKEHSVRMCDGRTLFDKLQAEQKKSAETSAYWKDYLMGGVLEGNVQTVKSKEGNVRCWSE